MIYVCVCVRAFWFHFVLFTICSVVKSAGNEQKMIECEGQRSVSKWAYIKFPNLINSVHVNWLHPLDLVMSHTLQPMFFSLVIFIYIGLMDFNSRIVLVQIETVHILLAIITSKLNQRTVQVEWRAHDDDDDVMCLGRKSTVSHSSCCHMTVMMIK